MVKLEETTNRRRLHIGSVFVDLNETDYRELITIFSLKETETWNAAIDAAAEGAMLSIPNGKDCKVISEIEINGEETFELNITVSKQSILNLKK